MEYYSGDITTANPGIIVQQVNAQGVMGSGLAKQIKEKWPKVFYDYRDSLTHPMDSENGLFHMGKVIYTKVNKDILVASIVGQQFYGREPGVQYTDLEFLKVGFRNVNQMALVLKREVNMPRIGCGLGGADWSDVYDTIEDIFTVPVIVWQL